MRANNINNSSSFNFVEFIFAQHPIQLAMIRVMNTWNLTGALADRFAEELLIYYLSAYASRKEVSRERERIYRATGIYIAKQVQESRDNNETRIIADAKTYTVIDYGK